MSVIAVSHPRAASLAGSARADSFPISGCTQRAADLSPPGQRAGILTWADQEQLQAGYLTTITVSYSTGGYALASDPVVLHGRWDWLGRFADKVRIRVTSAVPGTPLFAGIATADAAERYLSHVCHTTRPPSAAATSPNTREPRSPQP